jgi:hypothetical protein
LVGPGASEAELEAKADELEAPDEEFMTYPDNLTELLYGTWREFGAVCIA